MSEKKGERGDDLVHPESSGSGQSEAEDASSGKRVLSLSRSRVCPSCEEKEKGVWVLGDNGASDSFREEYFKREEWDRGGGE